VSRWFPFPLRVLRDLRGEFPPVGSEACPAKPASTRVDSWEDWYLRAMESTLDMEKSQSQKLAAKIKKAQDILRKSTKKQIESLNKL
jgi:hypothetical protein